MPSKDPMEAFRALLSLNVKVYLDGHPLEDGFEQLPAGHEIYDHACRIPARTVQSSPGWNSRKLAREERQARDAAFSEAKRCQMEGKRTEASQVRNFGILCRAF